MKRDIYARAGVREYGLCDPEEGEVTVLGLRGGGYENAAAARRGERFGSEVLAALEVSVEELLSG
jgi:Uma2 family endonuclease